MIWYMMLNTEVGQIFSYVGQWLWSITTDANFYLKMSTEMIIILITKYELICLNTAWAS